MTKFLLLSKYGGDADLEPMDNWEPADIRAHLDFLQSVNAELIESGELVGGLALTGPELAKLVRSDGMSAPVVTDGPFPEAKELLAGYQMIDVDSEARAIEIAAKVSSAPGPGGKAINQSIEVRQVMGTLPGIES
ncbi:MAG: YciI family protein [Actinomycetota bacterium]|nr:YciI family protein [Actinomycetota bacterium]